MCDRGVFEIGVWVEPAGVAGGHGTFKVEGAVEWNYHGLCYQATPVPGGYLVAVSDSGGVGICFVSSDQEWVVCPHKGTGD